MTAVLLAAGGAALYALLRLAVLHRQLPEAEFQQHVLRRKEYWFFVGVMLALAVWGAVVLEPGLREAPLVGVTAHGLAAQLYGATSERPHLGPDDEDEESPSNAPSIRQLAA